MTLHFLVPYIVAKAGWRENWIRPFMIMASTIAIDVDHLLVDLIFDPNRCSLGFHPLHSWPAVGIYFSLLLSSRFWILALGLLIHIILDGTDCMWILLMEPTFT